MLDGRADDGAGRSCEMSLVWCCEHRSMSYFPELGGAFFSRGCSRALSSRDVSVFMPL